MYFLVNAYPAKLLDVRISYNLHRCIGHMMWRVLLGNSLCELDPNVKVN